MADNVLITPGAGAVVAADDVGGVLHQRVKISLGADGVANDASAGAGAVGTGTQRVTLASDDPAVTALQILDNAISGSEMQVDVVAALPAGTNNIGDVDVLTVPADPFGANADASSATGSISAKLRAAATALEIVDDWDESDRAKVNLIVGQAGVAAGAGAVGATVPRVTLASDDPVTTAVQLIDDAIVADDAAFTPATTKVMMAGFEFDDAAPDSVNEGDGGAARMSANRSIYVNLRDNAGNERGLNVDANGRIGIVPYDTNGTAADYTTASLVNASAGATSIAANEDDASANGDRGLKIFARRTATPANQSGTDGDYEPPQISAGYLWVHDNKGLSNLAFSAVFSTLTRPANTTAYTAADSISDNGTAASVTALSATISDVNDDPIFISEILVHSTDTGLAGKKLRAYLYNSDPTASSGVVAGDNAAFSNKKAGYIGSFQGWMETGFSDGSVGRLVPTFNETNYSQAGGFVTTKPTSGARTLYIQFQAVEAFTPSANSTTIIGTARGWQGRAV